MKIIFYFLSIVFGFRPNFVVIVRDLRTKVCWMQQFAQFRGQSLTAIGSLNKVTDAFDGRIVEHKAYKDIVDLENISKSGVFEPYMSHVT